MTWSLTRWGAAAIMMIVCGSWAMGSVAQPKLITPGEVNDLPSKPANARIAYGSTPEQFGDLRLPTGKGPFPLAIVIHGGCQSRPS